MQLLKKNIIKELKNNKCYLFTHNVLIGLEEAKVEAILARRCERGHLFESCFNFLIGESFGQVLIHRGCHLASHMMDAFRYIL